MQAKLGSIGPARGTPAALDELLTTQQAAAGLGVGTSSVKRWADQGLLACVRTPGGHRRVPRAALTTLQVPDSVAAPRTIAPGWLERLTAPGPVAELVATLRRQRDEDRSWALACDAVADGLADLGGAWLAGEITVLDEHRASDRLERALLQICDAIPLPPAAPTWLLLAAPGDDHTLGLRLLELTLRELGVGVAWAGRRTPTDEVARLVTQGSLAAAAVSASASSDDGELLARFVTQVGQACSRAGTRLVLGGRGAWPEPAPYGVRLRRLADLPALVQPSRAAALRTRRHAGR
ncbi:MAG: helix-turn-helix domain-containing protein [Myxococcales bacterium]|nr:helix-turn-helix domain-containing protein [Myxococcales bacterium]